MKKINIIISALALTLSLFACDSVKTEEGTNIDTLQYDQTSSGVNERNTVDSTANVVSSESNSSSNSVKSENTNQNNSSTSSSEKDSSSSNSMDAERGKVSENANIREGQGRPY